MRPLASLLLITALPLTTAFVLTRLVMLRGHPAPDGPAPLASAAPAPTEDSRPLPAEGPVSRPTADQLRGALEVISSAKASETAVELGPLDEMIVESKYEISRRAAALRNAIELALVDRLEPCWPPDSAASVDLIFRVDINATEYKASLSNIVLERVLGNLTLPPQALDCFALRASTLRAAEPAPDHEFPDAYQGSDRVRVRTQGALACLPGLNPR